MGLKDATCYFGDILVLTMFFLEWNCIYPQFFPLEAQGRLGCCGIVGGWEGVLMVTCEL